MRRHRQAEPAAAPAAPPEGGRGGGPGGAATDNETQAVGTTLIVRELATAKDTTFGNVADFAWQNGDAAHLLAMSISADGQTGNGLHLFDPSTTVLRVLDSAAAAYTNLSWREKSADLAALKSKTDDKREGPAQIVLSWRGLGGASEKRLDFDPTTAGSGVAAGHADGVVPAPLVVERRRNHLRRPRELEGQAADAAGTRRRSRRQRQS